MQVWRPAPQSDPGARIRAVHIQPYFPEPVEVSRNAASERYVVTLGFIRRTMAGHALSAAAVTGVALVLVPSVTVGVAAYVFLGCLLGLTAVTRACDDFATETVDLILSHSAKIRVQRFAGFELFAVDKQRVGSWERVAMLVKVSEEFQTSVLKRG